VSESVTASMCDSQHISMISSCISNNLPSSSILKALIFLIVFLKKGSPSPQYIKVAGPGSPKESVLPSVVNGALKPLQPLFPITCNVSLLNSNCGVFASNNASNAILGPEIYSSSQVAPYKVSFDFELLQLTSKIVDMIKAKSVFMIIYFGFKITSKI